MTRISLHILLLLWLAALVPGVSQAAGTGHPVPAWPEQNGRAAQFSQLPVPTYAYPAVEGGLAATLKARVERDPFNLAATVIFFLAIAHTFAAGFFTRWGQRVERAHGERLARRLRTSWRRIRNCRFNWC